jgi:hypothetical protein
MKTGQTLVMTLALFAAVAWRPAASSAQTCGTGVYVS